MTVKDLVGEKVVVDDADYLYRNYRDWVDEHVPLILRGCWQFGEPITDFSSTYTIMACDYHSKINRILCYIRNDTNEDCFLIGIEGLGFINQDLDFDGIQNLINECYNLDPIKRNTYDDDNIEVGELSMLF